MKLVPYRICLGLLIALGLSACGDDDTTQTLPTYRVKVTNLTSSQPFSTPHVLLQKSGYSLWQQGSPASVPLEKLAEGGDGSDLKTLDGVTKVESADAPLFPGQQETFTFSIRPSDQGYVGVLTMLINTNDAFTGMQNFDLSKIALGETKKFRLPAYDAGTENNTEASGTMPGPADSGIGFEPDRTGDVDFVHLHPGVITQAGGLTTSVLTYQHKFDNPVAEVIITRLH